MTVVEAQDVRKSFGSYDVLKGVEFQANEGEIVAVIGKNGAGKSTFLEMLMTIQTPDAGGIHLFGKELHCLSINEKEQLRKQISVVLQPTQFYKTMKVYELLKLFQSYYDSTKDVNQVLAEFHLEPYRRTYFDKLSGGWKQIVSLAIAFMSQPRLLILDEPTTGLDPHMRNMLWNYITDYNKRMGGTVILTTHNMDEVELYCDKVMLLNNGIAEVLDTTERILERGYRSIHEFYLQNVTV
ncbi:MULTISPECIES: ABC transporter ATP-binding protein [Sporosarcina]|uniref:ABC transporter ATP-binding protein n=1 Tax=Sporosarcina TaxID=1569 RepID=UPI001FE78953|nr:ABC transporter ATP-binding protein [Sporosarcina aquimarina]